jgi:hypothetical protein
MDHPDTMQAMMLAMSKKRPLPLLQWADAPVRKAGGTSVCVWGIKEFRRVTFQKAGIKAGTASVSKVNNPVFPMG